MSTRARVAFWAAAAFAAAAAVPAFAAPQAMAIQASTAAKHAAAEHGIFGTITAVQSPQFTLRSVDGTTVHVDATQAIKSGDYSAPLFVGKRVLVTGSAGANGVFQAVSVSRQSSLRGLHSY